MIGRTLEVVPNLREIPNTQSQLIQLLAYICVVCVSFLCVFALGESSVQSHLHKFCARQVSSSSTIQVMWATSVLDGGTNIIHF
jgi:hypothetical protein